MNAWRKALGIGSILALLAAANAGCAASFEPDEVIEEATAELSSSGLPSQDDDDADGDDAPSGDGTTTGTLEVVPDPLPWKDLVPTPDLDLGVRRGPDPLPWVPGDPSTTGTPSSGTKKDQ